MLNVHTETLKLESFVDCVDMYALDKAPNKKQNHVYEVKRSCSLYSLLFHACGPLKTEDFSE